ncbi:MULTISPECIES: hypothetical protein [unclassified Kitasatospora]|uniref:hypothetical protein n=1 Tax=unclassified Kitasatospora TaxID=2633591 RepID=UPI0007093CC8|nr:MULTISPECIES: hypothetical protein [unclassified Kitasatospora]KQV20937.1 hypothetical protein ASC99_20755 [Kitasatospora sp. Root107]KRB60409.1 hypothetical protein ASE03_12425 [Kitasatospora sp. Root187]
MLHPRFENHEPAHLPAVPGKDEALRTGLESVLGRWGERTLQPSGDSVNPWAVLVTWTEGPGEFAGVLSHVVRGDNGAFVQLHQFLRSAESRLWERHDNDRALQVARARERIEAIAAALSDTAAGMLAAPTRPPGAALRRSGRPPAPQDPGGQADRSRAVPPAGGLPPRPSR